MTEPVRKLLWFLPFNAVISVIFFLLGSQWLDAWEGSVTSRAPNPQGNVQLVGIQLENGEWTTRRWPADLVKVLDVITESPVAPPLVTPEVAPKTKKSRFTLSFSVDVAGTARSVPTTSPGAFAFAILSFLAGIALRNMYVSGSPIDIQPRERVPTKAGPRTGQIQRAPTVKAAKTWPTGKGRGKR